jgi:hypothetical protein
MVVPLYDYYGLEAAAKVFRVHPCEPRHAVEYAVFEWCQDNATFENTGGGFETLEEAQAEARAIHRHRCDRAKVHP